MSSLSLLCGLQLTRYGSISPPYSRPEDKHLAQVLDKQHQFVFVISVTSTPATPTSHIRIYSSSRSIAATPLWHTSRKAAWLQPMGWEISTVDRGYEVLRLRLGWRRWESVCQQFTSRFPEVGDVEMDELDDIRSQYDSSRHQVKLFD